MTATAREIGERYFDAWTSGDFASARGQLHDDLSFKGPIESFGSADEFIASISQVAAGLLDHADKKKVFEDGDDVCIVYDFVTKTPIGPSLTVEWYRVRGGKIAEIRAVFDAHPFIVMREQAAAGS